MADFATLLRERRVASGWRQQDVVDRLGGGIARSTYANIEAGRERPTPRFWELLQAVLPDWAGLLEDAYVAARQPEAGRRTMPADDDRDTLLGGPFVIEQLRYIYVFRHSASPEEIVEVRRVRATRSGADSFGFKVGHTRSPRFRVEEEALWGGHLVERERHARDGGTVYLRRMVFDRKLRRGQVHDFGVRSWVEHDPDPDTAVAFSLTIPAKAVAIHLHFRGPKTPTDCWSYGPLADDGLVPDQFDDSAWLPLAEDGSVTAAWAKPLTGVDYGVRWRW
jgi:transcriptional regulator with XRE-family HTH domain